MSPQPITGQPSLPAWLLRKPVENCHTCGRFTSPGPYCESCMAEWAETRTEGE